MVSTGNRRVIKRANKTRPAKARKQVKSALQGIRVLEFGAFQQAPLATKWLAEAGAEVIKIEGLPGGDPGRGVTSAVSSGRSVNGPNWFHEYLNRDKKSVALRLEDKQARQVVYRLAEKSDVFVSNLRLPTLKKFGLDYDSLAAINPRLIYAQGTGFGLKGSEAGNPVLDLVGQARSGVLTFMGNLDNWAAIGNWSPCDKVAAMQLAFGILLAVIFRDRTGLGQRVDSSLLGAGIYLGAFEMLYYIGSGELSPRVTRKEVRNPLRNLYRTQDGRYLCLGMTQGDRYWPQFCKAVGIEHLQNDPRFKSMTLRAEHRTELIPILDQVFGSKPLSEWRQIFSNYDLIWSPVNNIPDVASDAQVVDNNYVADWTHQQLGHVKGIGTLVGLSKAPLSVGEPAPELGQHTEQVLLDIAGYSWEELAKLKEAGIII